MRPGGGRRAALAVLRPWVLELLRVVAIAVAAVLAVVLLVALGMWGGGQP